MTKKKFSLLNTDQTDSHQRVQLLPELIGRLSKANRHTLAYLLLHLKQVISKNFSNKLDKQTAATLFGPVIVGEELLQQTNSNTKHYQIKQAHVKRQIVLVLFELSIDFWKEVLKDCSGLCCCFYHVNHTYRNIIIIYFRIHHHCFETPNDQLSSGVDERTTASKLL